MPETIATAGQHKLCLDCSASLLCIGRIPREIRQCLRCGLLLVVGAGKLLPADHSSQPWMQPSKVRQFFTPRPVEMAVRVGFRCPCAEEVLHDNHRGIGEDDEGYIVQNHPPVWGKRD
jgi:hypothetical protein